MLVPRESEGYEFLFLVASLILIRLSNRMLCVVCGANRRMINLLTQPHTKHVRFGTQRGLDRGVCSDTGDEAAGCSRVCKTQQITSSGPDRTFQYVVVWVL